MKMNVDGNDQPKSKTCSLLNLQAPPTATNIELTERNRGEKLYCDKKRWNEKKKVKYEYSPNYPIPDFQYEPVELALHKDTQTCTTKAKYPLACILSVKILNWLWLFDLLVISASVSLELVYCILSSAEMTLSIPAEAVRKRTIVKRKKKIRNQNALAISRWVMCWLALWLVPRCIFLTPVFLFCYRAGWSRFWPEQFRLGQLCDRRIVETETERKRSWDLNLIMQNNHWVIWNNAFLT